MLQQQITMITQRAGNGFNAVENAKVCRALKATDYKDPPHICYAAGFISGTGAKAGGVGYGQEVAPTLRAGILADVVYQVQNMEKNTDAQTLPTDATLS